MEASLELFGSGGFCRPFSNPETLPWDGNTTACQCSRKRNTKPRRGASGTSCSSGQGHSEPLKVGVYTRNPAGWSALNIDEALQP